MLRLLRYAGFTAAISMITTSVYAALPQPGLWAIDGESNGNPGRGIQIDRQNGDRIIVSYFGYRADGSSMFLQAGGSVREDGKTFSEDLNEYKNGRAIGGNGRTGELAKIVGTLQMEFETATSGSITLPGEQRRAISRVAFGEHRNRLNNKFFLTRVELYDGMFSTTQDLLALTVTDSQVEFKLWLYNKRNACSFKGDLHPSGDGFTSTGSYKCDDDAIATTTPKFYRLEELKVDPMGFLSGILRTGGKADMSQSEVSKLFGTCLVDPEAVVLGVPGQGDRCSPQQLE